MGDREQPTLPGLARETQKRPIPRIVARDQIATLLNLQRHFTQPPQKRNLPS